MKKFRTIIAVFCIIFVIWTLYRYFLHPPDWLEVFVIKPINYLLPTFLALLVFQKQSVTALGLSRKNITKNLIIGCIVGLLLYGYLFVVKFFQGGHAVVGLQETNIFGITKIFCLSLATGITEEIVFRGYILGQLLILIKNAYINLFISSLLFSLVHIPYLLFIDHYAIFQSLHYVVYYFLVGIVFGLLYIQTRLLITPIVSHSIFNFLTDIIA